MEKYADYGLLIDYKYCTNCRSCEVACQQEKGLASDQFGIREFLDENIYSDSMLNSILGPAAIYTMHDGKVDIVRFNEQFYEAVDLRHFEERLHDISRFMPARDEARLLGMMKKAAQKSFSRSIQ